MAIGGKNSISIAIEGEFVGKPLQHRDQSRNGKKPTTTQQTHESQIRLSNYESLNGNRPTAKIPGRRAGTKTSSLFLSNPYLTHRFQHRSQELGGGTENGADTEKSFNNGRRDAGTSIIT
jgi:hypothetical protein